MGSPAEKAGATTAAPPTTGKEKHEDDSEDNDDDMGKNMTKNYLSHPILEFMRIIAELFDAWKSTDVADPHRGMQ